MDHVAQHLLAVLALLGAAGCSSPGEVERAGSRALPIVGGDPSGPEEDAVVKIISGGTDAPAMACTATLVGPRLIMTAAHCVAPFTYGDFRCTPAGELESSVGAGRIGEPFAAGTVAVFAGSVPSLDPAAHGVQIISTGTTNICTNDLAFVLLDRDLSAPRAVRLDRGPELGEPLTVIGYGLSDVDGAAGRVHRAGLPVLDIGPDSSTGTLTSTPPRTFLLGPAICEGDSGGPAIDSSGAVVGVAALIAGICTLSDSRGVFTTLAPFRDLVASVLADTADGGEADAGGDATPPAPRRRSSGCSVAEGPSRAGAASLLALLAYFRRRRRASQ